MKVEDLEIPSYFLCPISMELMTDPVTLSTGITYDRETIEKWLFSCKSATCPFTNQALSSTDLTPNHTLRRLIQAWSAVNPSIDRIPTPTPPVDTSQILKILNQAKNSPQAEANCLRRLRSIAARNQSSRKLLHAAGASKFLASVIRNGNDDVSRDEALSILHQMELSDSELKELKEPKTKPLWEPLTHVLEIGSSQSRGQAIFLLKSLFHVADPDDLIVSKPELYKQITRIVTGADRVSLRATKAALKVLLELCSLGRNKLTAIQNGAVWAAVDVILEAEDRRVCELGLEVLERLCGCAEGRAELLQHGAALAVVVKRILRVSGRASDLAVKVLCWISRSYTADGRVLKEMAAVGVVAKLCLVLKVECRQRTKERAAEILRRHSRVWRESSCIPQHLLSAYPS